MAPRSQVKGSGDKQIGKQHQRVSETTARWRAADGHFRQNVVEVEPRLDSIELAGGVAEKAGLISLAKARCYHLKGAPHFRVARVQLINREV